MPGSIKPHWRPYYSTTVALVLAKKPETECTLLLIHQLIDHYSILHFEIIWLHNVELLQHHVGSLRALMHSAHGQFVPLILLHPIWKVEAVHSVRIADWRRTAKMLGCKSELFMKLWLISIYQFVGEMLAFTAQCLAFVESLSIGQRNSAFYYIWQRKA